MALNILTGSTAIPETDEEGALLDQYRKVRKFGFGKVEVVIVAGRLEGLNLTLHKKRKDLKISPTPS
jgi:hypothetical protein